MRFDDLHFKRMDTYSPLHGPESWQARCEVNGVDISIRRGGKYLSADTDRPYEVLADGHEFGFMTSSAIDRLLAHIEAGEALEDFSEGLYSGH